MTIINNLNETILNLARPEIRDLTPYVSARSDNPSTNSEQIYLNANENNYPLPGYEHLNLHRYPEAAQPEKLIQKITELYNVQSDQIIITRGSDEAIDLLIRTFCRAYQDKILICPPTFGMYEFYANIQGASVVNIPLLKAQNFKLDTINLLQAWQPAIKLIFLCSPNNPTGNLLAKSDIIKICKALKGQALIVVDEAYIEFATTASLTQIMQEYPHLVILRTLSKLYGLAGARCGVAIAHPTIIYLLQKALPPYPLPVTTVETVYQHLTPTNLEIIKNNRELLIKEREKMYEFFQNQSFVKQVWRGDANFLLVEVNNAAALIKHCETHGIIIRNRNNDYGLENCVRISIGTAAENQRVREVLANG